MADSSKLRKITPESYRNRYVSGRTLSIVVLRISHIALINGWDISMFYPFETTTASNDGDFYRTSNRFFG